MLQSHRDLEDDVEPRERFTAFAEAVIDNAIMTAPGFKVIHDGAPTVEILKKDNSKDLEKYYNWEEMSLSHIIYLMMRVLEFQNVKYEIEERSNVESGLWHTVTVSDMDGVYQWSVDSQRPELLKKRLIKALDGRGFRQLYHSLKAI